MSKQVTTRWVCDKCGIDEYASGDGEYLLEGWVVSMIGDDLCRRCAP